MSAEIRVQDSFADQLSDVKNAANSIMCGWSLESADATATTQEFAARYERLQKLMGAYKELLVSDANELDKFYKDIMKLDQSLS